MKTIVIEVARYKPLDIHEVVLFSCPYAIFISDIHC